MAVTTGTTWDIVLNAASAHPEPGGFSPRAAYQAALYGRVIVVDLRTPAQRSRDGELPARLQPVLVDPLELAAWLHESLAPLIVLLDDDGDRAARLAAGDRRVGAVRGGFAGWREAGLPVA
ncbi:MAG: rhodanese-like domain-containing protein [Beutenbergiaceae bacterium]